MTTPHREDIFRIEDDGRRYRWNQRAQTWDAYGLSTKDLSYDEPNIVWFCELNKDNVVINATSIEARYAKNKDGKIDNDTGAEYCRSLFNVDSEWHIVDSTTGNVSIGWKFYPDRGAYIGPSPYPSWVLDSNNVWVAPVPYPNDGKAYYWDEDQRAWVLIPDEHLKAFPLLGVSE